MNQKYAVCVGNNYPGSNAELSGCVNDADDWHDLLAAQGYQVHLMTEATKADMVSALLELVAKTGFGDRAVFTYSGHGTWVPDQSGDEPDRRDEALVPADWANGSLLLDDELDQIFSRKRYGSGFLMLSDSCHSGSVTRVVADRAIGKPRFLPPTMLGRGIVAETQELSVRAATPAPNKVSLISGCGDAEYSYDATFNNRPNGAFTRVAIDAWRSGMTLGAWYKAIRLGLPTDFYPQSPELTSASPYRYYARAI